MDILLTAASMQQERVCSEVAGWGRRAAVVPLLLLIALANVASAQGRDDVDALLQRGEPPYGVVFEIAESDESALAELLPRVHAAIERIRARFPDTEFAVVSHGREEFALQSQYQDKLAPIHQQVRSLVAEDVPVYVCATHAGWRGVSAEDFPDYVNVAPTGPGQIQLYLEMDYELIFIQSSN